MFPLGGEIDIYLHLRHMSGFNVTRRLNYQEFQMANSTQGSDKNQTGKNPNQSDQQNQGNKPGQPGQQNQGQRGGGGGQSGSGSGQSSGDRSNDMNRNKEK